MNKEVKQQILDKIKEYDRIMLFRHVRNDGDCVGATKGMKRILQCTFPEKEIYLIDSDTAKYLEFMGPEDADVPDEVYATALGIVIDTASEARISNKKYSLCKELIKIDHHIFVEVLGTHLDFVDTSYCACCEMIAQIAYDNKVKMDKDIATPIFAGLVTDSGRFMFSSTTARTMNLASKLVNEGVDFVSLYAFLYAQDIESVKFKGFCQTNFKMTEHGVGYNIITKDIQEQFNVGPNQGAGVVNVLSNINGVPVWAHFSYKEDGTVKAELRSSGLPVNFIATKYGGGGHKQAAGCTLENDSLIESVLKDLDELVAKGE